MKDDRGQPVRVLNPAGFQDWPIDSDARLCRLTERVRLASVFRGWVMLLIGLVCGAILGAVWVVVSRWWVNPFVVLMSLPWWARYPVLGALVWPIYLLSKSLKARVHARRIAALLLEEGLCPSCGYNLHGMPVADGFVVCTECGAAWRARRVSRTAPMTPGGEDPDTVGTLLGGDTVSGAGIGSWTCEDDRGRLVKLVSPRLSGVLNTTDSEARRAAVAAVRQRLADEMWAGRFVLKFLAWAVGLLLAAAALRSSAASGISVGGRVFITVSLLAPALVITLGNFGCGRGRTRAALLRAQMCASCGGDLRGVTPEDDECRVCPQCRSAWRINSGGAPASDP